MTNDTRNTWTVIVNTLLAILTAIASALGMASCAKRVVTSNSSIYHVEQRQAYIPDTTQVPQRVLTQVYQPSKTQRSYD